MTRPTDILLGPPGTGKTTFGLAQQAQAIASGTDPSKIAYVAFTRKAAHEALSRTMSQYNLDADQFPYSGTLHSLGFKLKGLRPEQVINNNHLLELSKMLGPYTFASTYDERTERGHPDGELGDLCLFIYQLARSRKASLYETWTKFQEHSIKYGPPIVQTIPFHVVEYFARGLEEYKRAKSLLDFTDFLDGEHAPLDLDMLIIDEVQDLTPQQWDFARMIGRAAKRVLLLGDDDQAIYDWCGADVGYMLRIKGNRHVLPLSYRLPRAVFDAVCKISDRIKTRILKQFEPRCELGTCQWIQSADEVDLLSKEWLLLARTKHLCQSYIDHARRAGVVYEYQGKWSNQDTAVRAVLAYEALRSGRAVPRPLALLAACHARSHVASKQDLVSWEDVLWPFEASVRPDWMSALSSIGVEQREYIRLLRKNGESLTQPGRVRISTIHQAKGGECDNVVVLTDLGRKVENSFWADRDAELRVWYVALSRAKQNLFLVQPSHVSGLQGVM